MTIVPPTIRRGSKGSTVIKWQEILARGPKPTLWRNSAGVTRMWPAGWAWPLDADGDFGMKTQAATEFWQSDRKLTPDGVVGEETWSAGLSIRPPADTIPDVDLSDIAFVKAKGFYTRNRGLADITLVVFHTMEAPEKGSTAENVAAYFAGPNAPQASAHFCVDNDSVVQCVQEKDVAWHAPGKLGGKYVNDFSIGVEHAGYAKQTAEEWADRYSEAMLRKSAELVAQICAKYNIPPVWLTEDDLRAGNVHGITGHIQCTKATGSGTHWDPGPNFPHDHYIDLVREALAAQG